ncbi:probable EKC/KEOPS complex subunit LAGE3 [Coccomyxa sp. Obi]|nr:probable EKC/KEOPS complex subunit LAGE3 [Coccomyxa sp. Obi]
METATATHQTPAASEQVKQVELPPSHGGSAATLPSSPDAQLQPYEFHASHVYGSEADAQVVRDALAVDPELRPKLVTRELTVDGNTLHIFFSAVDTRTLRAAVGTFYDLLGLATRTLEAFGPAQPSS